MEEITWNQGKVEGWGKDKMKKERKEWGIGYIIKMSCRDRDEDLESRIKSRIK
jgi:hypothetical protein